MSRDDNEAPDPRHERTGSGGVAVVLLLLALLLVAAVGGGGFVLVRQTRKARLAADEAAEVARMEADLCAEALAEAERRPIAGGPTKDFRAGVGDPVTIDGLTVRVLSAAVGKVKLYAGNEKEIVEDDRWSLLVRIEALSVADTAKSYDYRTWRAVAKGFASDDLGNAYTGRTGAFSSEPSEFDHRRLLSDGDKVIDTVAFEAPVGKAIYVDLDLPGKNADVEGTFRFRIPRAAWEKK